MDELEGVEQLGRDGDLAPVLGAALQGPDPDRGGLEVDIHGPDGQGLGDPGAGVGEREGEGLVGRSRRQARGFEVAEEFMPIIHLVFSNLKNWLNGIHHDVSAKHLQA